MKKTILNLAIAISLVAGTMLNSCQSRMEKKEAAEDKVEDAKTDLREARQDEREASREVASEEEWKTFKSENEEKIREYENRIAEIRIKLKKPGKALDAKYEKRINDLEEKIRELKNRMSHYDATNSESNWESFKREFSHDMEEAGQALKDFTVDNER